MKRTRYNTVAWLLALVLAVSALSACSAKTADNRQTETASAAEAVTEVVAEDGIRLSNDASDFVRLC